MSSIGRPPPPAPQLPAVRAAQPEAVRHAQRAFFAAAAGQGASESAPPASAASPAAASPLPEPGRLLRPGSIIDIRV